MFTENEGFNPGSVARKLAYAIAYAVGEVLNSARPGWQYASSEEICAISGLTPEMAQELRMLYRDWAENDLG